MAYDSDYRITFINAVPSSDLLITIAEKQGFPSILKLWDLNKLVNLEIDAKDDPEMILKSKFQTQVLIQNNQNAYPVSCFTFNSDLTCLVVGYTDGKVILIRGDLIRDRGSKQRVIYESLDPVTGLHFNEFHEMVFVTTTSKILTVTTTGRNQGKPLKVLSKKSGVDLQCSALDTQTQQLLVGDEESIKYYNHLSKSHSINFEMPKKAIYRFEKDYLVIISPMEDNSATLRKLSTRVLIIDLNYKHVSFSLTIPNTAIRFVFEMWGDVYLLSTDGMLYKINEKPINQQIELVLQRELFQLAYQLAKKNKLPVQTLLKICKQQGDYHYEQQYFEESITSYMKCLTYYNDLNLKLDDEDEKLNDFIMNIITKFKDASNIGHMTEFLYKLYTLKIANNDHVTLLLCCYCKLKLVDRIRAFIEDLNLNSDSEELGTDNTTKADYLNLDFALIINLFKECGYFNEVIRLLFKLNQPNLIVDIQLNDLKKPQKCLNYVRTLPIDELLLILTEHSKVLLDNIPIETTELLIDVFTGKYLPLDNSKMFDLKYEINSKNDEPEVIDDQGFTIDSYKSFLTYISGKQVEDDQITVTSINNTEPTYLPPRPSLIFPSFVNHPNQFVIFLEACIETFDKYQGNISDKKELVVTLFEMYLSLSQKNPEQHEEWFQKSKDLLVEYSPLLDESSVLLISHLYLFDCGDILRKDGYEEESFTVAQLTGNTEKCLEIVQDYGDQKPELYVSFLRYIVSTEKAFKLVEKKQIEMIINKIKKHKIASPLEIIQILSSTEFASIGLIRDYLIEIIDVSNQEIKNNEKLVEFYEKESIKNSYKITELKTKPFIMQNNKCSACNLKLDFPVVHFKCKHSFHQRCLNDNYLSSNEVLNDQPTCSICINDIDLIQTLRDEQFKAKDDVDVFTATLQETHDKFKTITNYLGKGVMENEFIQVNNDI